MKRPAANWKTFAVDILGHISSSQKREKRIVLKRERFAENSGSPSDVCDPESMRSPRMGVHLGDYA